MGELDNEVIDVLKKFPKNRAQWCQIRNAILMQNSEINSEDLQNVLSVKLSRSLKRLEKKGFVVGEELGHKNVIYQLAKEYCQEPDVFSHYFGKFNPLKKMPTFTEFKNMFNEVDFSEADYNELYEDFKMKWKFFQNNENMK